MAKKKAAKKVMGLSEGVATSLEPGEERGVPTLEPPSAEEIAAVEEPMPEIQTDDPPAELIPSDLVIIEVPLRGEHDPGPGHVDAQLTRKQAHVLRRLQDGLRHQNEETADGKPVYSRASVVKWILEKIGLVGAK